MQKIKRIALVAHDNKKRDLIEWVEWNCKVLLPHQLICTGTTGRLVENALIKKIEEHYPKCTSENFDGHTPPELTIEKLKSGPLGGDQQLGALIAEGKIDFIIFFWDPMEPHSHDVDVKALLRIAVVYNIPIACNRSTADFLITSPLLCREYSPLKTDYTGYTERQLNMKAKSF